MIVGDLKMVVGALVLHLFPCLIELVSVCVCEYKCTHCLNQTLDLLLLFGIQVDPLTVFHIILFNLTIA